jgi:peroxiredoxin
MYNSRAPGADMPAADSFYELPENLPVPSDDGAADHLQGARVSSLPLPSTAGGVVDLSALRGSSVVYAYPRTGEPGGGVPDGWDVIPGARGCTPQSCAFRDAHSALGSLGVRVFGLSTQTTEYQLEAARRLRLPFPLLSDVDLAFMRKMKLPSFRFADMTLLKRLTLVIREGRIEHVFYPVFPPDKNVDEVLAWLRGRASRGLVEAG